jgi:hypothetical protein
MDRTEPPVGSKTLLQLYRRYNDTWVSGVWFAVYTLPCR